MDPKSSEPLPLFREHPGLTAGLPRIPLGVLPTPLEHHEELGRALELPGLFIKRDDLSGLRYGSNKVRKLEFLLAEAQAAGANRVFTIGFAGSNHALATALYARELGLACTSLLMPQAPADYVRRNLLASLGAGARLEPCPNLLALGLRFWQWRRRAHFIPAGGTCPLGVAAYVNAAYELRDQVRQGAMPEPDCLYVPLGSMGTAAGLALGLQAAGLRTQVVAVRVIEPRWASAAGMKRLLRRSLAFLRGLDPAFPELSAPGRNLRIRDEFLGPGYAIATPQGAEAAELVRERAGIELNSTYSAKAFAALAADARAGRLRDRTVLYWNTYNTRDLGFLTEGRDHQELPRAFHRYFEADLTEPPCTSARCGTGSSGSRSTTGPRGA